MDGHRSHPPGGPATDKAPALNWEVFMTPGIPIVTPDRPRGVKETHFQAMAATLISLWSSARAVKS
jgi:hypothetical protein